MNKCLSLLSKFPNLSVRNIILNITCLIMTVSLVPASEASSYKLNSKQKGTFVQTKKSLLKKYPKAKILRKSNFLFMDVPQDNEGCVRYTFEIQKNGDVLDVGPYMSCD